MDKDYKATCEQFLNSSGRLCNVRCESVMQHFLSESVKILLLVLWLWPQKWGCLFKQSALPWIFLCPCVCQRKHGTIEIYDIWFTTRAHRRPSGAWKCREYFFLSSLHLPYKFVLWRWFVCLEPSEFDSGSELRQSAKEMDVLRCFGNQELSILHRPIFYWHVFFSSLLSLLLWWQPA